MSQVINIDNWVYGWTWDRHIRVLDDSEAVERSYAAHALLGALADLYKKLREQIEATDGFASWETPFIQVRYDFPLSWDDSNNTFEPEGLNDWLLWRIRLSLDLLTAGVALARCEDGKLNPHLPDSIEQHLDGVSEAQRLSLLDRWVRADEWVKKIEGADDLRGASHRAIEGKGAVGEFRAALPFRILPRVVDREAGFSYFYLEAGIFWKATSESIEPTKWSEPERRGFWLAVESFFEQMGRRLIDLDFKHSTEIEVEGVQDESAGIERFQARLVDAKGHDYLSDLRISPWTDTPLRNIPAYAIGRHGPSLDVLDDMGQLCDLAPFRVMATMTHPQDEWLREEYLEKAHLRLVTNRLEKVPAEARSEWLAELYRDSDFLSISTLKVATYGRSLEEVMKDAQCGLDNARIVGQMFLIQLICSAFHPAHLSVNKAAYLMKKVLDRRRGTTEVPINNNHSKILELWSRYRSVAHLWAALETVLQNTEMSVDEILAESLPTFLAIAEVLRLAGEKSFAVAQRIKHGPILDPTKTWQVPPCLDLPKVSVNPRPLDQSTLELLDNYKASKTLKK